VRITTHGEYVSVDDLDADDLRTIPPALVAFVKELGSSGVVEPLTLEAFAAEVRRDASASTARQVPPVPVG
jgi:uncharacterized protein with GYD domain